MVAFLDTEYLTSQVKGGPPAKLVSIGLVICRKDFKEVDRFHSYIYTEDKLHDVFRELTGITEETLKNAPDYELVMEEVEERLAVWNVTRIFVWGPDQIVINFKYPGDCGFKAELIGTDACATLVCGKGYGKGQPPFAVPPTFMTHFVREIEGGIELRSRFWMGWNYVNGKDVKVLPDGMRYPDMAAMSLALHNVKEFTNLAAILPSLYAEEKDNWR